MGLMFSGVRLRALRLSTGQTQEATARRIGVSVRQYQLYEYGLQMPGANRLPLIVNAMGGCDIWDLYDGAPDPEPEFEDSTN